MDAISVLALLAIVLLLGFLGQWLAWWIRVPSIVFLFAGGLLAGPVTGVLSPDALFGDLLFPIVSLLIGIILFEGGLTLEFERIKNLKDPILRIVLLGGAVTFILSSLAAYVIFDYSLEWSVLLGAILIVTGPTVVLPLLHRIRPEGEVGSIARWEGIVIDPLGAITAVIVFEVILAETTGTAQGFGLGAWKFVKAMVLGIGIGFLTGWVTTVMFQHYWLPDYLYNLTILAGVAGSQAFCNHFVHESGLLAVTVMGMYMANQKRISVRHILHFKKDLRILFISILFILLVARLDPSFIYEIKLDQVLFLAALMFLVRPIAVAVSTIGSNISWPERAFLAWIAPRGIVAAAVASLFALELEQLGMKGADEFADVTFFVIAGTVLIYGFTLPPLSRFLGVSDDNPQGVLIIGAHKWGRELARCFRDADVLVRLLDTNPEHVRRARANSLSAQCIDVLKESELQTVDLQGIGHCLSITSNDEVNTLASIHTHDLGFERSDIFQLRPDGLSPEDGTGPDPFHGRFLFENGMDFDKIQRLHQSGGRFRLINISEEDDQGDFESGRSGSKHPVARVRDGKQVDVVTGGSGIDTVPGDVLVVFDSSDANETSDST